MCIYVDLLLKVVTWTITAEGGVNVTQVFSKHAVCCDWLSADQDSESVFQSLNFQTGNYEDSDPGRICCVESEAEVRHSSILWPENSRTALLYLCKPGSGFCFQLCRLNFEGNPELACRKQVRLKPTTFPDENRGSLWRFKIRLQTVLMHFEEPRQDFRHRWTAALGLISWVPLTLTSAQLHLVE